VDELPRVSGAALEAFRAAAPRLLADTAARALAVTEDVAQHGADARRLVTMGLEFTLRALDAAMADGRAELAEDELRWALVRLPHDAVSMEQVLSRFRLLRELVDESLPSAPAAEIAAVIAWFEARMVVLAAGSGAKPGSVGP
jgi:hypothetical protein